MIELPAALVAPETPDWVTVQANVAGVIVLERDIEVPVPEQIVCDVVEADPTGSAFTVMVPSIEASIHVEPVVKTV